MRRDGRNGAPAARCLLANTTQEGPIIHRCMLAVPALLLLGACYGSDGGTPPEGPEADPNTLRVLGGPVTCDGCESVMLSVAGPGLDAVLGARLVRPGDASVEVPAHLELRRVTGDSGRVLQVSIYAEDTVAAGSYDLRLLTLNDEGELIVSPALEVLRSWAAPIAAQPIGGVLQATVAAGGVLVDTAFRLEVIGSSASTGGPLIAGDTLNLAVPTGTLRVRLLDVAQNCRVQPAAEVELEVTGGVVTPVRFTATCEEPAYVRVRLSAQGDPVPGLTVRCDDAQCASVFVPSNSSVLLTVFSGSSVTVRLPRLPRYCTVVGEPVVTTGIAPGTTADVAFAIECAPAGIVRIALHVDGLRFSQFTAQDEAAYDEDSQSYWRIVLILAASVDHRTIGDYVLTLGQLPTGCTVTGPGVVTGNVGVGEIDDVAFAVSCSRLNPGFSRSAPGGPE